MEFIGYIAASICAVLNAYALYDTYKTKNCDCWTSLFYIIVEILNLIYYGHHQLWIYLCVCVVSLVPSLIAIGLQIYNKRRADV